MRNRKTFEGIYREAEQSAKEQRISELKAEQQQAIEDRSTIKDYMENYESDMPAVVVKIMKDKIRHLKVVISDTETRLKAYDEDSDI